MVESREKWERMGYKNSEEMPMVFLLVPQWIMCALVSDNRPPPRSSNTKQASITFTFPGAATNIKTE